MKPQVDGDLYYGPGALSSALRKDNMVYTINKYLIFALHALSSRGAFVLQNTRLLERVGTIQIFQESFIHLETKVRYKMMVSQLDETLLAKHKPLNSWNSSGVPRCALRQESCGPFFGREVWQDITLDLSGWRALVLFMRIEFGASNISPSI